LTTSKGDKWLSKHLTKDSRRGYEHASMQSQLNTSKHAI